MKKTIIYGMLACTLGAASSLQGVAQPQTYTLQQCREMALQQNARVKNAGNDLKGAAERRKEAFTAYFPTVSASGMGLAANKDLVELSLAPGMEMGMLKNGILGSVTAVQPVFAGGQVVNGNKLAHVGEEVGRLQLEQARNEVRITSDRYFWQVVVLQEKLKTVQTVDTLLQHLCKDVEAAVQAGMTTRNDLLEVQLRQNEIESTRITLESGIAVSKMLLAQYIGADTTGFRLAEQIPMGSMPERPEALYRDPSEALGATPEYRLLSKNVEAGRLQQKLAVGKNLPSVGVGASYFYHDFLGSGMSRGVLFASVSVPLSGWWGGSHAIKQRKLQVLNAENDLTDKSQLLVVRMQKAWSDVEDAYRQVDIARKSIEQATENLRLNSSYYRAGTITMGDLLQAQTLYRQSLDGYVDAYSAYRIKTAEYLQATGR